ncbi:hypothetical protein LMG26846_02066 [Achromobacter insuavis]|uniref:hypothetical protein n=1 Tax=Achromobacter insuavis TaxID=1287735 RepID=UPI0014679EC2|nr:hypothetical protein [Achromobacter insuavis]CAB3852473.1 hypothetical protein LMG26846_02066 [Achromobacter insuavis]
MVIQNDLDAFTEAYSDALQFTLNDKPDEVRRVKEWVDAEIAKLPPVTEGFQRQVPLMPSPSITPAQKARHAALTHLRRQLSSLS